MSARYEELKGLKNIGQKYAFTDREVMLYAYGIGLGADPMDENELAFVNEGTLTPRPLKVVPTFASVAAWGSGPGEMNLNRVMVVDGERDITFHQPLPVAAHITADSSVVEVYDKGKDKGVVISHQTVPCAPTASPAAACSRPMPTTMRAPSASTSRGSPRRSIPARA